MAIYGTSGGRASGRQSAASFSGSGGGIRVVLDQAALHQLLESPQGDVGKDITRRTLQVHRRAVQLSPVDTGRLRASITWRIATDSRGMLGIVGTNVDYAPHVEFGTRHMAAQPFLRPALYGAKGVSA